MFESKRLWICAGALLAALGLATACMSAPARVAGAAAGPDTATAAEYRVLKPIESGGLTLFPVVRTGGKATAGDAFLTLDEGLRSGEVEVTEAGSVHGLARMRPGSHRTPAQRGDEVNTLVLVNHSSKPLLLLAGEIVTGGKQDRIVATDRIVPAGAEPVDLSVFCIEPGRWTESSAQFGAAAKVPAQSFMVQPQVRQQAMVARDQQQVWNAVGGAISSMEIAAAPAMRPPSPGSTAPPPPTRTRSLGTSSYAKAMAQDAVAKKVDEAAPALTQSREQVLEQLKQEHAVGVVVAVHGEVIWADIFADTGLLTRYWSKLVRSYAAEELTDTRQHGGHASEADAQRFLDAPMRGEEKSEGVVGVYRYLQAQTGRTDQFVLESLLPGLSEDVHMSRVKVATTTAAADVPRTHQPPLVY